MPLLLVIVLGLVLAACQFATITPSPTERPPVTIDRAETPEITRPIATSEPRWVETQVDGVMLGLMMPAGWAADTTDGLIMAEHMNALYTGTSMAGMLVYVFVPSLDRFTLPTDENANVALAVLQQVVRMPHEIGHDVAASEPAPFIWSDHDAAYYLLNSGDGIKTIVLAIALPDVDKLVVCNISVPADQVDRIRQALPEVLDGLTINGHRLSGEALDALPEPLHFPAYRGHVRDAPAFFRPESFAAVVLQ